MRVRNIIAGLSLVHVGLAGRRCSSRPVGTSSLPVPSETNAASSSAATDVVLPTTTLGTVAVSNTVVPTTTAAITAITDDGSEPPSTTTSAVDDDAATTTTTTTTPSTPAQTSSPSLSIEVRSSSNLYDGVTIDISSFNYDIVSFSQASGDFFPAAEVLTVEPATGRLRTADVIDPTSREPEYGYYVVERSSTTARQPVLAVALARGGSVPTAYAFVVCDAAASVGQTLSCRSDDGVFTQFTPSNTRLYMGTSAVVNQYTFGLVVVGVDGQ